MYFKGSVLQFAKQGDAFEFEPALRGEKGGEQREQFTVMPRFFQTLRIPDGFLEIGKELLGAPNVRLAEAIAADKAAVFDAYRAYALPFAATYATFDLRGQPGKGEEG